MGRGSSSSSGSRGSSSSGGSRGSSFSHRRSYSHSHGTSINLSEGHSINSSYGREGFLLRFVGAFLFFFISLFPIGIGIGMIDNYFKHDSVEAICVGNEHGASGYYYTIYNYTIDNVEYENRSSTGWEFKETIGNTVTIYYLKSNPNKITEKAPEVFGVGVIVFALIFTAVGVGLFVTTLKDFKRAKALSNAPITEEKPKTSINGKIICSYCGASYNNKKDSCPKCGASQIKNQ